MVEQRVHPWMGELFYRGVAPAEIKEMSFEELRYWDGWHQVMAKAEKVLGG